MTRALLWACALGCLAWFASQFAGRLVGTDAPLTIFLSFLGFTLSAPGLWGLYRLNAPDGCGLGLIGVALITSAMAMLAVLIAAMIVAGPGLAGEMQLITSLAGVCLLLGLVLFGGSILLQKRFRPWAGISLIICSVAILIAPYSGAAAGVTFAISVIVPAVLGYLAALGLLGKVEKT
jgi:hypothetical protein